MNKIKEFLATKTGKQVYSFIKTYIIVFLTLYLYGIDHNGEEMFNFVFITGVVKYSLLSVIRNVYKLLTESNVNIKEN